MLKKILENKGVGYKRKGSKLYLEFKYHSSIYFAMKRILVEECGCFLSDKDVFGVKDHNHTIIIQSKNYDILKLNESKIVSILESEQIFEKIVFEEKMKQLNQDKEEDLYFKEKAIKVFATKRDLAKKFLLIQPLYFDRTKIWWMWSHAEKKWNITDETDILNLIDEHAMVNTIQSKERVEILEALRQEGRLNQPLALEKTWIQFKNTIIDINTGGQFEASPKYFAVNPIPFDLGETEDTPNIDRLFKEWVGENSYLTLQEFCAYCLLPDYPLHHIFFLIGSGCNGKGKFTTFLKRFIGHENATSVDFDLLVKSQFESWSLYKKLFCLVSETNFNTSAKTSKLKRLSGQDPVKFEDKRVSAIEGINYAKICILSNNLPETQDKTKGWYRRTIVIDFPHEFPEGKDPLLQIPDEEYNNFARKCTRLLKELLHRGTFKNVGTIKEREERYEERSNPLDKFISNYVELTHNSEDKVPKWMLRDSYKDFLMANGYNVQHASDTAIMQKMKEFDVEDGRPYFEGLPYLAEGERKKWTAWYGIRIKKSSSKEDLTDEVKKYVEDSVFFSKKEFTARYDVTLLQKLLEKGYIMETSPNNYQKVK